MKDIMDQVKRMKHRFIAQPFVPQNAVVTPGTQVVWFSGDVGHDHNIVVRDTNSNNNTIFETGDFPNLRLLDLSHLTTRGPSIMPIP